MSPNGLQLNGSTSSLTLAQNDSLTIWSDGAVYWFDGGLNASGAGISEVTSVDGSVEITDPTGPTTDLRSRSTPGHVVLSGLSPATSFSPPTRHARARP